MKLVDPAQLLKAREEKRAMLEAKAAKRSAAARAEHQKRLAKLEKGRTPPSEMFRPPHVAAGTFGSWDADGLPLTDPEGNPLSKNAIKKAQKDYANQVKAHKEFLEWQAQQAG